MAPANTKQKIFRDSVHGYIAIPDNFCQSFVNTELFQRLRHIEQTSMRVLYPSARHDRFVHSLGVYHLGQLAFERLQSNSHEIISGILNAENLNGLRSTFVIACLLHDCGHAPFSHTFEHYYDRPRLGEQHRPLDQKLRDLANNTDFNEDYRYCSPAPHEKASAILVLSRFANEIRSHGGDPLLAARMILGCIFRSSASDELRVKNCLIQLLNGKAIDVDKLDYIIRDTWASGVNNVSIDVNRLLGALTIGRNQERFVIGFNKSALSVVQSVVTGRNFLYQWIYSHHKVLYDQLILKAAIQKLARLITTTEEPFLSTVFSMDALNGSVEIAGHHFYLPTDGDLIYLMKKYRTEIPEAQEWLSRQHQAKALWKTYAEFNACFEGITDQDRDVIQKRAKDCLASLCNARGWEKEFSIVDAQAKIARLQRDELYIIIDDRPYSYHPFIDNSSAEKSPAYFMAYAPLCAISSRAEIIRSLRGLAG